METLEDLINECEKRHYTLSIQTGKRFNWFIHGKSHIVDNENTSIYDTSYDNDKNPETIDEMISQIEHALTKLPLDGEE